MSSTSDQTTQQNKKTRLIIDEIGVDTETGIIGRGHSYDNGKTFTVDKTIYGRIFHKSDHDQVWKGIQDKVKTVVEPARSAADSAYSKAQAAIDSAQVTSEAMSDIASATAEAKQGADDAMSRALSAWDVATGAKEAVTDFDPLIKSAQSDASKALAQIADTANALSDAKTEFGSGVAEAKELAITAQTTANSAVESAGENAKELASQANALSDAKKAIDSDVASAKGLANAAQATADNAIKSASSVANDLSVVASQAKSNANGITKVTSDVGLLQTTVANNTGDISTIQETAKQIQQSVSDNAGNITVAKQTADSAVTVASDAKSNATVAVQTASGASVTAKNAQGDATTAMTTANSAVIQASDAKSNATVAVQTASEASLTAANAKGDASIAKQTASDASVQIKNAQGDISKLQTRAGAIETSVANNSGAIADVQATANQLKASVSDNAGNITIAKQTADSAVTVASDAKSNATVASQTASQASITAQNASGQAASAVLTANGAMTTASDAKSDATVAIQTASGASLTATNAQGDASIAKQTASEAKVQASNAESDFAQLSVRANKIETNVANNSGAIASVQQTANGLTTTVGNVDNRVKTIEDKTNWTTKTGPLDMNTLTTTQNIYYRDSNLKNADGETGWAYIQVVSMGERVTQTVWHDRSSIQHTRTGAVSGSSYNWDAWNTVATNAQVVQVKNTVDGISTTINDPKTGLNATYQTAAGNATTISNVKSDVYQLQTTANGLTSRVGNLESKTNTQQTTIDQNKAAIALKADQTTVNTLKGTVNQNTATLNTQASQIQAKVSASDVSGMLKGYATQDYTQSLVTQKADQWNLNLTKLQTNVNAIKTTGGGVNLQQGTGDCSLPISGNGTNVTIEKFDDYTNMIHASGNSSGFYIGYTSGRFIPEVGKTYTFSCDIKGQGQISGGGLRYEGGDDGTMGAITLTDNWTRISNTIHVNAISGTWVIYLNPINGKVDFYVKHIMIEEGIVAHPWSPAPSDMATVTSVTNLSATVDGIQSQVYNSDGSSKITQLSNVIQTKVGTDDFNNLKQSVGLQTLDSADINNMKTNGHYFVHNLANNPIGGWVYVDVTGDGSSRIRQDVYQDNGTKHKYRRWYNAYWTGWEEGATYTEINQLQDAINLRVTKGDLISQINLQAGTALIQSNKLVLDAGTTVFTGDAFIPSAAISSISADKIMLGSTSLYNSDGTLNLVNKNDGTTSKITVSQGNVNFDGVNKNASIIKFASDNNTNAFTVNPTGATVTPTLFFERFDQTVGHWLGFTRNEVEHEGVTFHTWDDEAERFFISCHARFDKNLRTLGTLSQGSWDGTTAKPEAGVLTIKNGNTIWSGSNFLAIGDNLSNSYTNVMAKSFSQQSTLSSKTNIETVDPKDALDLVNRTDIRSYQYTSDVEQGKTKRYTSLILDDVHDVSQYYAPDEFANEERTGRDDGSAVGYLFLAVKELTRRIKNLEEKLNG